MTGDQPGGGAASRRARGSLAAEVLAVLRAADAPLSPGQVRDRLAAGGRPEPLSYSTVVTVLSRLHAKGLAARSKRGHAFAYAAITDEPGLVARRMRQVLDGGPDREAVLARFVGGLASDDEDLLRRLLGTGLPGPGDMS